MKTCPICNSEFEKFNPFGHTAAILREVEIIGGGGRPEALCPGCGSLDRERLIYLYLREETSLLEPILRSVLHIAPSPRLARVIQANRALDYYSAAPEAGKMMLQMDLTDNQYSLQRFDVIICVHVLEHIEDDAKAMAKLYRVLKPGGWALLQVPLSRVLEETLEDPEVRTPKERYAAYGQRDHVRIYAERDYVKRLGAAGFEVRMYSTDAETAERYGLDDRERLYIGGKRGEISLIDMEEKRYWYQYSLVFYWWTFKRLIDLIVHQPLCWLGIHRAYDGYFHSYIDKFGDSDSVKCFHCGYCHRPTDQKWHDRYTNGEDWRMNIFDIMKLAWGMSLVTLAIKTIEDAIKRERAR